MMFEVMYWHHKQVPRTTQEKKAQLEIDADPILHNYFTNPELRPVYDRSQATIWRKVGPELVSEYQFTGAPYDELRDRTLSFQPHLVAKIFADPARVHLTLLLLLDGTYINPGFHRIDSIFLFIFNVILDFLSVTITIYSLQRLEPPNTSFRKAIAAFVYAFCGTLASAVVAFLSYRLFFRGNTSFFWQAFFVLPLSLFAAVTGLAFSFQFLYLMFRWVAKRDPPEDSAAIGYFVFAFAGCGLGLDGLAYVWSYLHRASVGLTSWRDVFSFPYVLAGTTLIPATLTVAVFVLMLAAKMIAEPARLLQWSYMTFVKQEVGGTHGGAGAAVLTAAPVALVADRAHSATRKFSPNVHSAE
jgi:hypothetical protein